jgi:hypothetical protein
METMIIKAIPSTRRDIAIVTMKAVQEILSGDINPLETAIKLKAFEEILKSLKENLSIKNYILEEASKYPEKTFDAYGASITKAKRTTYDFTMCGDQVYAELMAQMDQLKKVIKAREEVIKAGVDPVTGETFLPPKTETSEYLTIKFQ